MEGPGLDIAWSNEKELMQFGSTWSNEYRDDGIARVGVGGYRGNRE